MSLWDFIRLGPNNLAWEGLERSFTNQNWLRSWYVNLATNVPFSLLCVCLFDLFSSIHNSLWKILFCFCVCCLVLLEWIRHKHSLNQGTKKIWFLTNWFSADFQRVYWLFATTLTFGIKEKLEQSKKPYFWESKDDLDTIATSQIIGYR